VVVGVVAAWVVAIAAQATGSAELLHHDALADGGPPLPVALVVFVAAWQLMILAMMVPSSLPLIRLFRATAARQPDPARANAALLAGYAAVWTSFGVVAFLGDVALHRIVERSVWLESNPQLISGAVLVLAGVFQFSDLKDRCLRECRHPGPFLLQHYGRGAAAAFRLGRKHGVFCLGCCWALMLVGFAVGVANLWWMAALTAVMVYEKTARDGDRAAAPIGVALIVIGTLTVVAPDWSAFAR
jgi:predicted metal-binding membrane protein